MKGNKLSKSNVSLFLTTILLTSLILIISNSCSAAETTKIGMIPSTETVFVGDEFNLTIYIDPTEEIGGWSLDLSFTQGMVNATNVTAGSYWTNYFDEGNVSNDLGTITDIQTWSEGPYPSVNHTACIVSFTAVHPGICNIELVNVQITDSEFQDVEFIRCNTTITIESNGDDNANDGNGEGSDDPDGETKNQPPIANVSVSDPFQRFAGSVITFDGSSSYDPDGDIILWYWDFGDGTNGSAEIITQVYSSPDVYTINLTVTHDNGVRDSYETSVVINQPTIPPENPTVDGPSSGSKNIEYSYTAVSTDADGDNISYTFDWDDGSGNTETEFVGNNTVINAKHTWTSADVYVLKVYALDENMARSGATEMMVFIDVQVEFINDAIEGYLIDYDFDGTYDSFHNNATGQKTDVEQQDNGTYLMIDSDGDGEWDYSYDPVTSAFTEYDQVDEETTSNAKWYALSIGTILAITVLFIIYFAIKLKGRQKK